MVDYYARKLYTGTGAQTEFTIDFEYLSTADVKATIGGVATSAFTVVGNTVTFTTAPSNGAAIIIYRQTTLDVIQEFINSGTPSSGGFNEVFLRIQYIVQEARDTTVAVGTELIPTIPAFATITEVLTGTSIDTILSPDALAGLWEQGVDIASGATLSIPATGGGYFNVTGTTTITRIDQATAPKTGRKVRIKFAGILTFTNNANIILPGGASITTAAGDSAELICESTTASNQIWRCVQYTKASGLPVVSTPITAATQAEMEAASNGTATVVPNVVKHHPGVAKAWTKFTSVTTTAITTSYNVSSLTDNGTGDTTINFTTAFSNADYVWTSGTFSSTGNTPSVASVDSGVPPTTSACRVRCTQTSASTLFDSALQVLAFFGDQ